MELVLATGNAGKVAELAPLLAPLGIRLRPQSDFGVSEAVESGLSFAENALIKARHASRRAGLPALADDSGLCVDALDGAPGIYSARYAGPRAGASANNEKLLQALMGIPAGKRGAHFHATLAFVRHANDQEPLLAEGRWFGTILDSPQGEGGFGYDPLFFVPEYGCSAAQLVPGIKNRVSHRGQAVARFLSLFQERLRTGELKPGI
ncbi:RdgB/HAM1 family non-canonical purine NTP pyrophosphatase [Thermithiobacillus plumbiphilus]|uniref:dITP/XTP pyrophosphatase n=1 Tax=Thermithiobacillus plumbiphilus TaxID=1729899 RepID=A0ABU9DB50_9PROT